MIIDFFCYEGHKSIKVLNIVTHLEGERARAQWLPECLVIMSWIWSPAKQKP